MHTIFLLLKDEVAGKPFTEERPAQNQLAQVLKELIQILKHKLALLFGLSLKIKLFVCRLKKQLLKDLLESFARRMISLLKKQTYNEIARMGWVVYFFQWF